MYQQAIDYLSNKDEKLKPIMQGLRLEEVVISQNIYVALLRSIIYQQLSGKAASTIHGRFLDLFDEQYPDAQTILQFDIEALRSAGLSKQKASYIQNVAKFNLEHDIENRNWEDWENQDLTKHLTQIKGVGKWTVQMILMFSLNRLDVFPDDDLGIQQGMARLYNIQYNNKKELKRKMNTIAEVWKPYRSIAARYIWKWKDDKK